MVPPVSHRVSRVPWYSGSSPLEIDFRLPGSHRLWQAFPGLSANQFPLLDCPQPQRINPLVWPLPRSLATSGISVDFSSSPYLDVSVQAVPHLRLFDSTQVDRVLLCRVSPSEISGSTVICTSPKLIAACHVLHRLLMPRHSPCALLRLTLLSCEQESKQRKLSWTTTSRQCLLLPLLSYSPLYTKKGLALVLKRLNYAGSEFFGNCLCYLFEKFHKSFLFPLLLALHTWLLCSVFKVRFQLLSKPDPNTQSPECLHPISHYLTGTRPRRDAESRAQAFWRSQNLAAGAIHLPRGCPIPFGAPHLMAIKWGGGPKWTRTTDLTIISRAL